MDGRIPVFILCLQLNCRRSLNVFPTTYAICLSSVHKPSVLTIAKAFLAVCAKPPSQPDASNFTNPAGDKVSVCNLFVVFFVFVERFHFYVEFCATHTLLPMIRLVGIHFELSQRRVSHSI